MVNRLDDRDSHRARHLAVVDAGADHRAEPGPLDQEIQRDRSGDGYSHQHQPVGRKHKAEHPRRRPQVLRRRHRNQIAAPQREARVRNDERHAERDQHLSERIALQPRQHQPLEQPAERGDDQSGAERGDPEIEAVEGAHRYRRKISAEHEERAMREVGQPHQPEDQGKSRRQQEQQPAERQAVETLDDPKLHRLPFHLSPEGRGRRRSVMRGLR